MIKAIPFRRVEKSEHYHWFVVGTVCVGAFMAALDASIMNIALPTLQRTFQVGMSDAEWVSLVYLLTLAAVIVPFGRLADMLGRRWIYAFGFLVFLIGSGLCGVAQDYPGLLIFRVIQAIGAAMLQANSVSIITAVVPQSSRGRAIGIQASAQAIGLSLGPIVGGALLAFSNWRWIFFVNLPVALIGLLVAIVVLPADRPVEQRRPFDVIGAVLLMPALVSLVFVLNRGGENGWTSGIDVLSEIIAVICLTLFVYRESHVKWPLVNLSLFRNLTFTFGNVCGILSFSVMYAVLLLTPYYLDSVMRLDTLQSGLYLTGIPLGMAICTPFAGAIADRYGVRTPSAIGMLVATLGCILLSWMSPSHTYLLLVLGLLCVGSGMGLFTPPNNSSVMGSVPMAHLGVAGGLLNMSRTLGMGLGVTCGGLTYQLFLASHTAHGVEQASTWEMVWAFRAAYLIIAGFALLTAILSVVGRGER
jgi:EmrB/QacA subfamily drug resistance transporter